MQAHIIAVDESASCDAGFVKDCGGRIHVIYVFDKDEHTYCCSITPSHWLEPVGVITAAPVTESVLEEITAEFYDLTHYRDSHCCGNSIEVKGDFEKLDDAVEYCQANIGYVHSLAMNVIDKGMLS